MVQHFIIRDAKSLQLWLGTRPESSRQRDAVLLAHRAAMRVLPRYLCQLGEDWAREHDLSALSILRFCVISGAYVGRPLPEVKKAAPAADAFAAADVTAARSATGAAPAAAAFAAADAAARAAAANSPFSAAFTAARAVADAASTAHASARANFWKTIRADAVLIEAGVLGPGLPLWVQAGQEDVLPEPGDWSPVMPPDWLAREWRVSRDWLASQPGHDIWIRWYEAALEGSPLVGDWEGHAGLLSEIALLPDDNWQQGPVHVAKLIGKIEYRYSHRFSLATQLAAERLTRGALHPFSFDQLRRLMDFLPFPEDLGLLSESEALEIFLRDMEGRRAEIELFVQAVRRDTGRLQGAAGIWTYFEAILEEITRARQQQRLNVGLILMSGEILSEYARSPAVRAELGPLTIPFDRTIRALLGRAHQHFAETFVRIAPLMEGRSTDEMGLAELMQEIRRGLARLRDAALEAAGLSRPQEIEVFGALLDEIERVITAEFRPAAPREEPRTAPRIRVTAVTHRADRRARSPD